MATVITSLATVIPVVGKTILSFLWGGLSKASRQKTLLDAGTGFLELIKFQYVWNYFMNNLGALYLEELFQNKVKTFHMISKSAGLFKGICSYSDLPLINSQRPNARDLMWLVGFVEGDGCFSVNKNGKYVKYEFAIEIHISDIKLLHKIKSILGGYGSITTRKRSNTELARLKISSKYNLKNIILPIFDKYGMLTSKQYDYLYFKSCLLQNITFYEHLPIYERPEYTPFNSTQDILNLYYFDAWLVGFMEAESYFSTFQVTGESNKTAKFGISQTNGIQIITAIKERLSLNSNPFINQKTNSGPCAPPQGLREGPDSGLRPSCCVIDTSSVRGVQNVINFLKKTPVKLKGNKRGQFLKWLHELRVNSRYRNINIPNHY
jgi:hypothetical protein